MSKQEFYILLNKLAIRDTEGIIERGLFIYRETYQRLPLSSNDSHYYELFKEGLLRGASIKEIFNKICVDLRRLEVSAPYEFRMPNLERTGTIKKPYRGYFTQREFLIRFGVRLVDRFMAMGNLPLTAKMLMQGKSESFIYYHYEKSKQEHT